jgi:hypothetical protein
MAAMGSKVKYRQNLTKKYFFDLSTVFDYQIWKKIGIHILVVSKIKPVKTFLGGGYKGQVEVILGSIWCRPRS